MKHRTEKSVVTDKKNLTDVNEKYNNTIAYLMTEETVSFSSSSSCRTLICCRAKAGMEWQEKATSSLRTLSSRAGKKKIERNELKVISQSTSGNLYRRA